MKIFTRILLGFAVILILCMTATLMSLYQIYQVRGAAEDYQSSVDVSRASALFTNGMVRMQSAYRGYLLSLNPQFITGFDSLRKVMPQRLESLSAAVDQPEQMLRVDTVEQLYGRWEVTASTNLHFVGKRSAVPHGPGGVTKSEDEIFLGKQIADSAFQALARLEAFESRELANRQELLSDRMQTIILTLIGLTAGLCLAGGYGAWTIATNIRNRLKTLTHLTKRIASGEYKTYIRDSAGDELSELGSSFNQMTEALQASFEKLKKANLELEQFAWVASHDLKEPLRMVSLYTQKLGKDYSDKIDEEGKEYIQYATEGVRRMYDLINSLLEYSRVGRDGLAAEPISVKRLMNEVLQTLRPEIEEAGTEVQILEVPEILHASPILMRQVFQNILHNALKFHRDGVKPEITVAAVHRSGEWIFSIRDNGIGIDEQYKERVFVIFQRLNDRNKFPGSGIGLAVCKKIVELHGGRIWMDSMPEKGTTFYFSIPDPFPIPKRHRMAAG